MEYVKLNNIRYRFARDFKHDEVIRFSFNKLTEATFGFSLEEWYQSGFWADNYIPYSLLHNNEVISNVSVTIIEFDIDKERKTGVQIGTVMTDEKYRHRGLNKFIMERVIDDWKDQSDFIYLFANDSVLDFYPKFDFEIIDEYQFSKQVISDNTPSNIKRLNIEEPPNATLLLETINASVPTSAISMRNNPSLIMFYCLSYKKNSIYYIDKLKAIAIAEYKGDCLYLNEVFSKSPVDLNALIQAMSDDTVEKVVLGFTPLQESGFERCLLNDGDTLFVQKDSAGLLSGRQGRFPVLSRA